MASRPSGYGMAAELQRQKEGKYDPELEQARVWMEAVVGESIIEGVDEPLGSDRMHEGLKDGVFLLKLANKITEKSIKINDSKMAFKMMENIGKFLDAMYSYGVPKTDMFQTVDLYENQNMAQVINCIHAVGRKAHANGFEGPVLGPKEAQANVREFTDEQLRASEGVIGLQMGDNRGASQAGINYGHTRHITD